MKVFLFIFVSFVFVSNRLLAYSIVEKSIQPFLSELFFGWNEPKTAYTGLFTFRNNQKGLRNYSPIFGKIDRKKLQMLIEEKERQNKEKRRQEKENFIFRKYLANSMSSMKNDFLTLRY